MKKHTLRLAALLGFAAFAAPLAAQNFQKFVTVGDSLIAGEESGCVMQRFQERSWVTLAAASLGQAAFQQPFIQEVAPTNPLTNYPCLGAVFNGAAITVEPVSMIGANTNLELPRPYDNLGFNGSPTIIDFTQLTVTHPGASDLDNLAAPVLRNCVGCPFEGMSAVDEANLLTPDLVAFWGGNNDALNAMGAGAAIYGVTLTPVDQFTTGYNAALAGLSAAGRTVVVFNVPDVSSVPFATTIPPVLVDPTTLAPIVVGGNLVPLLGPGDDAFPCTPTPPDQGCPLPEGALVTLPASSLLGMTPPIGVPVAVGGSGIPLPHGQLVGSMFVPGVVLYPDDLQRISDATSGYNQAIAAAAAANGAIPIDANGLLKTVAAQGYSIGGLTFTKTYITGGIFGYDGVHPSAIGYGIIADAFIQTLNAAAHTSYPRPNFSQILFTPNVSPFLGAAAGSASALGASEGGPWHYSFDTWQRSWVAGLASRGLTVMMPSIPRAVRVVNPAPKRATRTAKTVTRASSD